MCQENTKLESPELQISFKVLLRYFPEINWRRKCHLWRERLSAFNQKSYLPFFFFFWSSRNIPFLIFISNKVSLKSPLVHCWVARTVTFINKNSLKSCPLFINAFDVLLRCNSTHAIWEAPRSICMQRTFRWACSPWLKGTLNKWNRGECRHSCFGRLCCILFATQLLGRVSSVAGC